jgi:hypothetical protein
MTGIMADDIINLGEAVRQGLACDPGSSSEAIWLQKCAVILFGPNHKWNQIFQSERFLAEVMKRIIDDPMFTENLQLADVVDQLLNWLTRRRPFNISNFIWSHLKNKTDIRQFIEKMIKWIGQGPRLLSEGRFKLWMILCQTLSEYFDNQEKAETRFQILEIKVEKTKTQKLNPNTKLLFLEITDWEPRFKRGTLISMVHKKRVNAIIRVNGIELTVPLKKVIPLPANSDSSLKRIKTETSYPSTTWFYDHRHGWVAGKVVSINPVRLDDDSVKDQYCIEVQSSNQSITRKQLLHKNILRRLGAETLYVDEVQTFQVARDADCVRQQLSEAWSNLNNHFALSIEYDLYNTFAGPDDKFYQHFTHDSIGNYTKATKYLNHTFYTHEFLNKSFEWIPRSKFDDEFLMNIKRSIEQSKPQIWMLVYFTVAKLEPALFIAHHERLLELIVLTIDALKADQLRNLTITSLMVIILTIRTFIKRALPRQLVNKIFDRVLSDIVQTFADRKGNEFKLFFLAYNMFPSLVNRFYFSFSKQQNIFEPIILTMDSKYSNGRSLEELVSRSLHLHRLPNINFQANDANFVSIIKSLFKNFDSILLAFLDIKVKTRHRVLEKNKSPNVSCKHTADSSRADSILSWIT